MAFDVNTARAFAAQFVPGGEVLMIAGNLIPDSIRNFPFNLLGGLPRGELQKFRRTIFPALVAKAQASNGIAAAVWFGEIILVRADGSVDTVARNMHDLSAALSALRTLAARMGQVIFVFRCPAGIDFEVPSQVSSRCSFDAFLPPEEVPPRREPGETEVDMAPPPGSPLPITPEITQAGMIPLSGENLGLYFILGLGLFLLLQR